MNRKSRKYKIGRVGDLVVRNIRIQVLMSLTEYNDAVTIAKELGLIFKNDSELIRRMIYSWEKLMLDKIRLETLVKQKDRELLEANSVIQQIRNKQEVKKSKAN